MVGLKANLTSARPTTAAGDFAAEGGGPGIFFVNLHAEMNPRVKLSELVQAFDWVSAMGPFENEAYVSRASGRVWLVSDLDDSGEDPPEDVGDESLYLSVPSKNELDLGRSLALRFAREQLPESYERVKDFFARSGAYGRFKDFLEERDRLEAWYAYEAKGVEEALRAWASDNDVELVEDPSEAA